MKSPVTQREIARKLGLSIATVSRALNDQPGVSPEIRAQVLEAAREMGYFPHLPARSLVTATTHTVAFVFHSEHAASDDPFYPIIMTGAESYLSQQGYHVLMSTIDDQVLENPHLFTPVSQGMVDGLILAGPTIAPSFILAMLGAGIPLVLVDNSLPQTPVNCVLNDDEGGTYAAARHLIEHGYTRIAFLSGPEEWVSNRERARGYCRAMYEVGLQPLVVHETETTIASGERAMQRLLEEHPDVEAICAVNDAVAIGAIRAAARMGRRTPGDLAVIGFDDISWAQLNDPPLSTVHVFKRQIGVLAAQRLLDCIQNPDTPPARVLVSTRLVLRASCGH